MPSFHHSDYDDPTNESTLRATRDLQKQSLDALARIRRQAAETEAVGGATLAQLEEQDRRLDDTMAAATNLNDNLKKTESLQNRNARLSLQFGNRGTARRQVREEKKFLGLSSGKEEQPLRPSEQPATFKRRGPRPSNSKKTTDAAFPPSETAADTLDEALASSTKASKEVDVEMDKAELFSGCRRRPAKGTTNKGGGRNNNTTNKQKRGGSRSSPTTAEDTTPLTDEDRDQLAGIDDDDKVIDEGLDVLGGQLDSLFALSKSLGDTAKGQNKKLTAIHDDLDKADEKQRTVNQRAKLFMMNRKEKTKESNRFNPMSVLR